MQAEEKEYNNIFLMVGICAFDSILSADGAISDAIKC